MRRTLVIPTALLLSALALTGCAAGASSDYLSTESGGYAPAAPMEQMAGDSEVAVGATDLDRSVITTGYVTVTVDNPLEASGEAIRIAEQAGGRVDGRSEYAPSGGNKGSATLTLRIPADKLTATLDQLKELGAVQEVSLNSSDVTMVTQDLEARITAYRASIERLLALVETATDTDTLIQLETAITDRQAQLESLESEQRYYDDQISLSTVTLNLVSDYTAPVAEPDTFLTGLLAGWNAFVAFFAGLLVALGVLLPWIIFAGIVTLVIILLVKRSNRRKAVAVAPVAEPVAEAPVVAEKPATRKATPKK